MEYDNCDCQLNLKRILTSSEETSEPLPALTLPVLTAS